MLDIPVIGGASHALVAQRDGVLRRVSRWSCTPQCTIGGWFQMMIARDCILSIEHLARENCHHDCNLANAELFYLCGNRWRLLVAVKEG